MKITTITNTIITIWHRAICLVVTNKGSPNTTSKKKTSILSFNINGIHHYDLGLIIDKMGVAIRTGHHCTQPLMKKYNIPGTARISLAVYNNKNDIDLCISAIEKAKKMLLNE